MLSKTMISVGLIMAVSLSNAATLTISDATVTLVQVYETPDDSTRVWLHLNGNSRVGPNPVNASTTCELWTDNQAVYSAALAALMSGKKVAVDYMDRGEGTYWCKVRHFAVKNN